MATALQRQLAGLQSNRNNELDLRAQKAAHATSLLFDRALAATQSFDSLFHICLDGFEQLCVLDSRFVPFRSTLFSPNSKSQDRNLLTASENDDLSRVIETFLALVGRSLLLKPAQQAIEWLIRRFRVHELNTEALVLAFLPHHLSPLFLTLLSILPTKLPASLRTLHPYANAVSNPPRKALVQAAIQNPSFFAAINRHVLTVSKFRSHYPALISLWAGLMAQGIDSLLDTASSSQQGTQRQRTQDILTRVLPVLNEALTLKNIPELITASHIAFTIIITKAGLDDRALDSMMSSLALSMTSDTCETALACLALIADHKSSLVLPYTAWNLIIRCQNLDRHLERLSHHQNVQNLAKGIALGILSRIHSRHTPGAVEILRIIVTSNLLQTGERVALIEALTSTLQNVTSDPQGSGQDQQQQIQDIESCLTACTNFAFDRTIPASEKMKLQAHAQDLSPEIHSQLKRELPSLDQILSPGYETDFVKGASRGHCESFLMKDSSLPFNKLARAFEVVLPYTTQLSDFLELPILGRSIAESSPLFLSFLAKIWCSSQSVAARSTALHIASEEMKQLQQRSLDLQVWVPYALIGLADRSRSVRRRAADLLIALEAFEFKQTKSIRNYDMIYGEHTKNLTWLPGEVVSDFIRKCLNPSLEECVSDASHIVAVLQVGLGSRTAAESLPKERRLTTDQKLLIFSFISTHTNLTNSSSAILILLKLLNTIGKIGGRPRSYFLLPCLRGYVSEFNVHSKNCKDERVEEIELMSQMFKIAPHTDQNALKFLYAVATGTSGVTSANLQLCAFRRISAIWSRLPRSDQFSIFVDLFRFVLSPSTNPEDLGAAMTVLKNVRIHSDVVKALITEALVTRSQSPAHKKRRTGNGEDVNVESGEKSDTKYLARLTLALELLETHSGSLSLIHLQGLFEVLQELQNYNMRTKSDLAYLTNLTLSAMSRITKGINGDSKSTRLAAQMVRPDLLVDCVRNTNSPQTRSSALLLLSDFARLVPQVILHSVMPIFTMMSATTARLSDEFSAYVVDQTIVDVVPVLVHKLHERKRDLVSATAEIILSFAASFDHIPPHRRLQLFQLLASSLGADESLFAIIATLSDRFPANSEVLKFSSTLLLQFGSSVSLVTVYKTLDLVIDGLDPAPKQFQILMKKDPGTGGSDHSCLNLIQTLSTLLNDESFQATLHLDVNAGNANSNELKQSLRLCFERIFKVSSLAPASMKSKTSEILEQILLLFPINAMAISIEPLLGHPDDSLCKALLATLEKRVRNDQKHDKASRTAILSLLPYLTLILETNTRPALKPRALACVDQICEKFGKMDKSAVLKVAKVVASKSCLESRDALIQTLSFHCLASTVEVLQNEFIPLVSPVEEATCTALRACMTANDGRLHNAVFAFLIALVENIPFIVSEDFFRVILELSQRCTLASFGQEAQQNRSQFLKLAAAELDLPIIVRATLNSWRDAVMKGPEVLREYTYLIQDIFESHSRSDMYRDSPDVFNLFVEVLDLRYVALSCPGYSSQDLDSLEYTITEALIALVLKVNDTIFRPFFVQLVDWSSSTSLEDDSQASNFRSTSLFNLMLGLSERLKSIFTPYFGHVLNRASQVLQDRSSNPHLIKSVLGALTSSFKHDHDDFWQRPPHFESVFEPLVSQLSNPSVRTLTPQVITGIVEFGVAASSNEHHKTINGQLLRLCRHDSNRTRLAAVVCQQKLTERLGDEWLSNLPEMLPRINELQEDDDEEVEKETHRWIKLIEDKLGESLNSMLK